MTTLTLTQVDKKNAQAQTDIQKLTQRKGEIEAEIASRWGQDTAQLEVEYSGIEARLRASNIVLSGLEAERVEAQCAETIKLAEKADKEHRAACTKLMECDDSLRRAFLSLIQNDLAAYKQAKQRYDETERAAQTTHAAALRAGADLQPVYVNDEPVDVSIAREILPALNTFWMRFATGKTDIIW